MKVTASKHLEKPVGEVFAFVDDWTNAVRFVAELTKWEPAGEKTHGLGSRFAAAMRLGPTTQESTIEITEWEQDRVIAWEPLEGFKQSGEYLFEPDGDGTKVTFTMDLTLPGGLAGRVLGKTIEPMAKVVTAKSLGNLKDLLGG